MTTIKIYKDEVPINRPCHIYIENKFKLIEKMNQLTPKYSGQDLIRLKIDADIDKILSGVLDATNKYKWWGWINKNEYTLRSEHNKIRRKNEGIDHLVRGSYYGGWSIKYNPLYCKSQGLTPESAGMGELPSPISWLLYSELGADIYKDIEDSQQLLPLTRIAVEYGYNSVLKYLIRCNLITEEQSKNVKLPPEKTLNPFHREKDGYYDTWSFTDWTNASKESGIKELTDNSNCQVLRSRVAWQRGEFRNYRVNGDYEGKNDKWTWHSDEPVVHNIRIVIPIQTSDAYAMEIKPHPPKILEKGYAYTWNTNIVHRQLQINNNSNLDRIFIILGFNPWFNWIPEEQAWISNEFYNKVHPLDMVSKGLILPNISFDKIIQ